MPQPGTLYGLGVGPGDPELLTIKAARILGECDAVLAAASTKNKHSIALDIARAHIRPETEIIRLGFPMTRDKSVQRDAWRQNARITADILEQGKNAAFITLGDPSLYSTFSYLLPALRTVLPDVETEIVPGVTSFQEAAAKTKRPLAQALESLLVFPGAADDQTLRRLIPQTENTVILKAYKNFPEIRQTLTDMGLADRTAFASRLGHPDEIVLPTLENTPDKPNYLSLCLVKKGEE